MRAKLARLDQSIVEHRLDRAVLRRIENYVGNWSHATARLLARSARFFPIFEDQLLGRGMPTGLKFMAVQESALRPYATSRVGAGGLWQLMPGTARELGLTVNDVLDERLDAELGCAAGLTYLQIQYDRYGDWALAMAAYNCGPGNVNKALRRSRGRDYWSIRRHLPRETRDYLPNIIAAAYVMAFHQLHGVAPAPMDLDLQLTESVTVRRRLSLYRVAQVTGLRPAVVVELNPQYLRGYLPGWPGGHRLRLPTRVVPALRRYLALHPASAPENTVALPWASPRLHTGELHSERHYDQYHTVVAAADTSLRQVAEAYRLPVDQLAVWSNLGEYDSLAAGTAVYFYRVARYLPYDPRDRGTPPAAPRIANHPPAPVRLMARKPLAPAVRTPAAPTGTSRVGLGSRLRSWFSW